MKDASSHPTGFNPNYEERREEFLPAQANTSGKLRKPATRSADARQSPECRATDDEGRNPPTEPASKQQ